tara:strand:+ start:1013 stop:1270 length:258 start_codon:yes stop_codon:yes gene_type:complete
MSKQKTNQYIEKNFELSSAFNEYIMKHDEVMKSVPDTGITLVFIPFNDSGLAKYNINLAKKNRKYDKWPLYQAIQHESGWQVLPI